MMAFPNQNPKCKSAYFSDDSSWPRSSALVHSVPLTSHKSFPKCDVQVLRECRPTGDLRCSCRSFKVIALRVECGKRHCVTLTQNGAWDICCENFYTFSVEMCGFFIAFWFCNSWKQNCQSLHIHWLAPIYYLKTFSHGPDDTWMF